MASIRKRPRSAQRPRLPKTLAQYHAKPTRSQDAIDNVAHVITRMREGFSLKSAAAEYNVAPRTVVRLGKSALRKRADGRYVAKASDQLLRVLVVPARGGLTEVAVRGSRTASEVSEYFAASREFLDTGDDTKLRRYRRRTFKDASGRDVRYFTDLDELERLGDAGVLAFESIYARST